MSELLRMWPCQNCLHWSIEIQNTFFFTLKSEINFKRRNEIELVVIIRKKKVLANIGILLIETLFYAWILTSYWGRQKKGRSEMVMSYHFI